MADHQAAQARALEKKQANINNEYMSAREKKYNLANDLAKEVLKENQESYENSNQTDSDKNSTVDNKNALSTEVATENTDNLLSNIPGFSYLSAGASYFSGLFSGNSPDTIDESRLLGAPAPGFSPYTPGDTDSGNALVVGVVNSDINSATE